MFKVFDTMEEFNAKNDALNIYLGYPNADGSILTYAEPIETIDGKFAMQVLPNVEDQFDPSELVETIEIKQTPVGPGGF
jgi:hypothetical protein